MENCNNTAEQNQCQKEIGVEEAGHFQTAENSIETGDKKLHPRNVNEPGYISLNPGEYMYLNGKKYFNPTVRTPLVQLAFDAQNDVVAMQKFLKQMTPMFSNWARKLSVGNRIFSQGDILSMIYETIWKAIYVKKITPFRNSNSEPLLLWVVKMDIMNVSNRIKSKKQSTLRSKDYVYGGTTLDSFLDGRADEDGDGSYSSPIISEENYKYDVEKKMLKDEKHLAFHSLINKIANNLSEDLSYIFKIWVSFIISNQDYLEGILKEEHKTNYSDLIKTKEEDKFLYYVSCPMIAIARIVGVSPGTMTNRKNQIINSIKDKEDLHKEFKTIMAYC